MYRSVNNSFSWRWNRLALLLMLAVSNSVNAQDMPPDKAEPKAVDGQVTPKTVSIKQASPDFVVLRARLERNSSSVDLTKRIQAAAQDGLLVVFVESGLTPARKSGELILQVKMGGVPKELKFGHREFVFLDSRAGKEIAAEGLVILDAFYGTGIVGEDTMIDARKLVEAEVEDNAISVSVKKLVAGVRDPAFGLSKVLIVRYALNGTVRTQMFEEHQTVEIKAGDPMPGSQPPAEHSVPFPGKGKKAGDEWPDGPLSLKFCWCPEGKFKMGSRPKEVGRATEFSRAQEDQVNVTLTHGFWMSRYELTQATWEAVMKTTLEAQRIKALSAESNSVAPDIPMFCISYDEARSFCEKLTATEREADRLPKEWAYRLPTEAQWEYACRAGTTSVTHYGDSLGSDQANFNGTKPYGKAKPGKNLFAVQPVGRYQPNAWGLYDMHGNVNEWCLDALSQKLPGGKDPLSQNDSGTFVYRGGCTYVGGRSCRSADRNYGERDTRSEGLGFRPVIVYLPKK